MRVEGEVGRAGHEDEQGESLEGETGDHDDCRPSQPGRCCAEATEGHAAAQGLQDEGRTSQGMN